MNSFSPCDRSGTRKISFVFRNVLDGRCSSGCTSNDVCVEFFTRFGGIGVSNLGKCGSIFQRESKERNFLDRLVERMARGV